MFWRNIHTTFIALSLSIFRQTQVPFFTNSSRVKGYLPPFPPKKMVTRHALFYFTALCRVPCDVSINGLFFPVSITVNKRCCLINCRTTLFSHGNCVVTALLVATCAIFCCSQQTTILRKIPSNISLGKRANKKVLWLVRMELKM